MLCKCRGAEKEKVHEIINLDYVKKEYRCEASYGEYDQKIQDFRGGNVSCYSIPDEALKKRYDLTNGLSHSYCYKLAYTEDRLWVSHWDEERGLSVINITTDEVKVIKQSKNGVALGGRHLAVDGRYLWIGQNTGVVKLDTETLEATRYSAQYGSLPGCWVSGIEVDNDAVWVALSGTDCQDNCNQSGIVKFKRTP
jgi:ligand-binding sensor domain-containing protein